MVLWEKPDSQKVVCQRNARQVDLGSCAPLNKKRTLYLFSCQSTGKGLGCVAYYCRVRAISPRPYPVKPTPRASLSFFCFFFFFARQVMATDILGQSLLIQQLLR